MRSGLFAKKYYGRNWNYSEFNNDTPKRLVDQYCELLKVYKKTLLLKDEESFKANIRSCYRQGESVRNALHELFQEKGLAYFHDVKSSEKLITNLCANPGRVKDYSIYYESYNEDLYRKLVVDCNYRKLKLGTKDMIYKQTKNDNINQSLSPLISKAKSFSELAIINLKKSYMRLLSEILPIKD